MTTFDQLLNLCRAGANLLHIASYEWERVRGSVVGLAKELGLPLKVWSQVARSSAHLPLLVRCR